MMKTGFNKWFFAVMCGAVFCAMPGPVRADVEYVTARAVTVNAAGQDLQLAAGQGVSVIGISNGMAMIRVTLPNGSLSVAQVPVTSLLQKVPVPPAVAAVSPAAAAPPPAPAPALAKPTPTPAFFHGTAGFATVWKPDPAVEQLDSQPGLKVYEETGSRKTGNEYAVYIPAAYNASTPMPLVVSSHGAGGTGPREEKQWEKFANQIGFIVVCPTFTSASNGGGEEVDKLKSDDKMLLNVMKRVLGSLNIDRRHVMFTGFSGGGVPAWYLASKDSQIFTALCFRSANFHGVANNLQNIMQKWRNRPIYLYISEKDAPGVTAENPDALNFLQKKLNAKNFKYEVLPTTGHSGHPEYAAKWFQSLIEAGDPQEKANAT